jgi:hypothetical protein
MPTRRGSGFVLLATVFLLALVLGARSVRAEDLPILLQYPLDQTSGVTDAALAVVDPSTSHDGRASLRFDVQKPTTIHLFDTGDLNVENLRLVYQAWLKTKDATGPVYLEMLCRFPGKGEFFSRALDQKIQGTQDWRLQTTPFFLKKGENPDDVKLNLVVEGTGTIWIDAIGLSTGPLQ